MNSKHTAEFTAQEISTIMRALELFEKCHKNGHAFVQNIATVRVIGQERDQSTLDLIETIVDKINATGPFIMEFTQ